MLPTHAQYKLLLARNFMTNNFVNHTNAANPTQPRRLSVLLVSLLMGSVAALPLSAQAMEESRGGSELTAEEAAKPLPKLSSLEQTEELKLTLPDIQKFTTASGVPVVFVATPTLPIVDVDLRFNAGSARDADIRADGFGIASMTATMLEQGTEQLNEDEFTAAVETLGINLSTRAYKDMFIVSLRSLSDEAHLSPALALVEQMLASPSFDTATLARNKARLLVGLQQQQQDPGSIAAIAFSENLFGDHPYAHPSSGTLKTVPSLTQTDLRQFKDRYLVAKNATLAITGDLTLAEAKKLADSLTSVLAKGSAAPKLPEPKELTASKRIHIPFDSTQTTIIMGQLGDKHAQDVRELQSRTNFAVGNDVLAGGDFNARLMTEVRKNLGYTYGISGGMSPMQTRGPYQISFSTRNDKAEAAIDATLKTVKQTLKEGISNEEMGLTKDSIKNSFPMSFASNAGINGLMGMMNFYQLPDSYLSDYLTRVDKVDLAGVNTALRQKINPDKFLIVTVGDQTAIDSSDSDNAATEPTDSDANNTDSNISGSSDNDENNTDLNISDTNTSGANIVEKRTLKPIQ
jgi:zinc protease